MIGLENRGETLIFMSRHFDETMTILISHFLRFGALKFLTGNYYVLRTENGMFYSFQYFASTFPTAYFPHSYVYRMVYK